MIPYRQLPSNRLFVPKTQSFEKWLNFWILRFRFYPSHEQNFKICKLRALSQKLCDFKTFAENLPSAQCAISLLFVKQCFNLQILKIFSRVW